MTDHSESATPALPGLVQILRSHARDCMDMERWATPELAPLLHRAADVIEGIPAAAATTRACTCHPDDNPPRPCPQKFAYSDCVAAAATPQDIQERIAELQYEAGMYQALYENACAIINGLELEHKLAHDDWKRSEAVIAATPPCPRCGYNAGPQGAERYWEARWRDEKAENERLRGAAQVPIEPTPEMISAGMGEIPEDGAEYEHVEAAYRAMVAAAMTSPPRETGDR